MSQNYSDPYSTYKVVYVKPIDSNNVAYHYPSSNQNTNPNSMLGNNNQRVYTEAQLPTPQQVNITVETVLTKFIHFIASTLKYQ